jgi:NCK-associated protein 1
MSRPRQLYSEQGSPPKSMKYRESESMSRWSEYLNTEELTSPSTSNSWKNNSGTDAGAGGGQRTLQLESVIQLSRVAEGLLTKMYRLFSILDFPDLSSHTFSENFWKAGIIPNIPKICVLVSKKFPEHPSKLQLERVKLHLS